MKTLLKSLLVGILLLGTPAAQAAFSPAAVSILGPVQFPPSDFSIIGARASVFWGRHRGVYGADLGVIGNITDLDFVGVGVSGIFNITHGDTTILALQAAGITNVNTNKTRVIGLQVAGLLNLNHAETTIVGLGIAPLGNFGPYAQVWGAQLGLYNRAREVYGFQIGLINVTESLHGIQIGLLNFNTRGFFAVAPILNIGF